MVSMADTRWNLKDICNALGTVKHKWFVIGVQLSVPHHELEEFKKEDDPLAAVINYCLKGNVEGVPPNWESVVEALKSHHVGERGLAATIRGKYCPQNTSSAQEDGRASTCQCSESIAASKVDTNTTSSGSSSQLSEVELQAYFPYLKNLPERERRANLARLFDENDKIRIKFADLVLDFQENLEKSKQELKDIVNYIKYYFHDEELAEIEKLLDPCETIGEVFDKVRKYTSFFNIGVIKPLIKKFGAPAIEKKLKKYKKKFREYCKHRICECPRNAFDDDGDDDDEKETDKIYVLKTEMKITDNLEKLEDAMNKIFLGKRFLRLLQIKEGCVELTFRVLAGLDFEVQQQRLRDNGVLCVSHGDQQYDLSHLTPTTTPSAKPDHPSSSGDSAYVSASATQSSTLYTATTGSDEITPDEKLLKSAQPTGIDSSADFHYIIRRGNLNQLELAMKKKEYNPLSKDAYGYTALHTAAKYGKLEVLKYLIEREGLNPSTPGLQGTTPLNIAAEARSLSIVKYLIEEQLVDPSTDKDEDGYLPLHHACQTNRLNIVKYLFQKMKEVSYMESNDILNESSKHDTAPLHIAALHSNIDIVKYFIEECECDPNLPNKAGKTALFFACESGSLQVVQYLVEVHHCQLSTTDNNGTTPLHLAAQHGHLSIIQYLIEERNCDPMCKNKLGNTLLLEASFAGMLDVMKYLIKIGCDPKLHGNSNGYNCLHAACHCGCLAVIQYLIEERHMDPKTPVAKTKTNSLHIAATNGHEPTIRYLIDERKLDPNLRNDDDYTPIHLAAIHNHLDIIKFLFEKKDCAPLVSNSRRETPLSLAKANRNHKIADYLSQFFKPHFFEQPTNTMFYVNMVGSGNLDMIKQHKWEILHLISLNMFNPPLIIFAVLAGKLEIVKYFVEEGFYKADCNSGTQDITTLHVAAQSGHIEIFQYLVKEHNCDPMCRTSCSDITTYNTTYLSSTPLHYAVAGGQFLMVRHILESDYGINPEVETYNGATPLIIAAKRGYLEITKYLMNKHKCNPYHRDTYSKTVLHRTAEEGHLDMMKYLINNQRCDPTVEDINGFTPFHCACITGRLEVINYYITELKTNPNLCNGREKTTALHVAAFYGHMQIVKYLTGLPHCKCSCADQSKYTPLHFAAENGKTEIVKYLTKTAKCNHMDQTITGETPLHLAAENGHFEVTKFLTQEMHTPPAVKNVGGLTPLHLALSKGHAEVALYLIVVFYNECRRIL